MDFFWLVLFLGWKRDFKLKSSVILEKADQTLGLNLSSGVDTLAVMRHLSMRGTSLAARYLPGCDVGCSASHPAGALLFPGEAVE